MPTLTFTPQQAAHVAALIQQARAAHEALDGAVRLLTLGATLPEGAELFHVDTDTGVFTFHDTNPPSEPGPHAA